MNKLTRTVQFIQTFRFSQSWFDQNQAVVVRAGVLSVLVFLVLYAVPRIVVGDHKVPTFLVLGIFALAGLLLLLRYPILPLFGIVPAALAIPYGMGTGTETVLPAVVLLVLVALGLWVLDMMIVQKEIRFMPHRSVLAALLLAASSVLSFGFGQIPWFYQPHAPIPAQIGGVMLFVLASGTFLVVAHRLTRPVLKWSVIVLIILGGVYVSLRPFQSSYYSLTWPILQFYANGSAGSLFWVWLFCIAISQLLLNNSLRLIWKAAIAFVLVMFLYSAFFIGRDWTSGWLPALAGGGVILFLVFKRARIPLVIVGLLVIALNWDQVRSVVMVGDNTYSLGTRLDAWKIMFKMISYNPILGFGPANYYFYTPLFPIRGYSVMFNSHNNYVDLLAQTGIIGTGLFIWLFAEVILLGFRLSKQVSQGFDRAFVYGVIGGAVGTLAAGMLGDWVIPFVYNVGFAGFRASLLGWFFMGALLALARFSKVIPNSQNP